jgi:hypothetical protein
MKRMIFAAALCAATAFAGPALADNWKEAVNGSVSAVPMADGAVMMKIEVPAKDFGMLVTNMKAGHKTCTIQNIYPDAHNTMILVCDRN